MRYIVAIIITFLVFAIIIGGKYNHQEMVEVTIHLEPTPVAQPGLVESSLAEYDGILSVRLSTDDNQLHITYDKARITIEDLNPLLISLGYKPVSVGAARIRAAM
ncbi:MAG: hypothetical protein JSU77_05955 [Fidelibacterota bacterium]|nr:MAG: hypothetical protein JSU77_05955 [Candidatus Neomarinimicrobiota bacterium]